MKSEKGFATTGILYSILVLFLFFILLILNNFQARKVLFDKQKDTVLEKLETNELGNVLIQEFTYADDINLYEFITPKEGIYEIKVWGAGTAGYVSGNVELYQGIKLYIETNSVDSTNNFSSVRTEKNKINTTILKAYGSNGSTDNFVYNEAYINNNGEISEITLEPVTESVSLSVTGIPAKSTIAGTNGYVLITFMSELNV